MTQPVKEKDIRALRTALVCVGLSGVFLALFVVLAGGKSWVIPPVCMLVGAGVVLMGMFRRLSAGVSRPMRIFIYWLLSALLVLELMVPLNYAGAKRQLTFDWTEGNIRSLSDWTVKVLSRVEKPLRVTTFFVHSEQGAIFNVVRDLLEQYRRVCPSIVIEHVDPSRDTDRMTTLQKQMNIEDVSEMASVVFQYGDARRDVPIWKLMPRQMPGQAPEETNPTQAAFYGEEEFTAAILEVTEKNRKGLYFTTNHGELSIDKELADAASELRRNNYAVVKFAGLAEGVPDNCTVLLIVGPEERAQFTDKEQAEVARHLARGGKLFFAVSGGGPMGLEPMLGDFGIYVGRNVIIDTSTGRATPLVPAYPVGNHDVVSNLREYAIVFNYARSVEAMPPQPGMMGQNYRQAVNLLQTGKNCWAESDVEALIRDRSASFDPKVDKAGPLGVAAAYEQSARLPYGQEIPKDMPRTRIVAVGCSDFMVGRTASLFYGNLQFFFNAVNWLAEQEELISIPPKRFDYRPLDEMKGASETLIFWLTTVAMPAFFLILGGVIWLVRRGS